MKNFEVESDAEFNVDNLLTLNKIIYFINFINCHSAWTSSLVLIAFQIYHRDNPLWCKFGVHSDITPHTTYYHQRLDCRLSWIMVGKVLMRLQIRQGEKGWGCDIIGIYGSKKAFNSKILMIIKITLNSSYFAVCFKNGVK